MTPLVGDYQIDIHDAVHTKTTHLGTIVWTFERTLSKTLTVLYLSFRVDACDMPSIVIVGCALVDWIRFHLFRSHVQRSAAEN